MDSLVFNEISINRSHTPSKMKITATGILSLSYACHASMYGIVWTCADQMIARLIPYRSIITITNFGGYLKLIGQ